MNNDNGGGGTTTSSTNQQGSTATVGSGAGTTTPASTGTSPSSTPQPIEINEDSLVRLPGRAEPVKYGEWSRGYQGEFTRAKQEAAKLRKEIEAAKREREDLATRLTGNRVAEDPFAELEGLPYLTGPQARQVVERLQGELTRRDQALLILAKEFQKAQEAMKGVVSTHAETEHKAKIGRFREQLGLPNEAEEFLSELYAGYEGPDLDEQFPSIAKKRWEQLQNIFKSAQKAKVDAAKRSLVPMRGGEGSTTKPLDVSRLSAKELADLAWPGDKENDT